MNNNEKKTNNTYSSKFIEIECDLQAVLLFFWMSTIFQISTVVEILRGWGFFIGASKYKKTVDHWCNFSYSGPDIFVMFHGSA